MGKDRSRRGRDPKRGPRRGASPHRGAIALAQVEGRAGQFELVHPACVHETALDYQDGLELWKAGDPEGAQDALRYALQACRDNQWVHLALGHIALHEFHDPALARGHFGYVVELTRQAIPHGFRGSLPRSRPANEAFYDAIDGLISCFCALGKNREAESIRAWAQDLADAEQNPPASTPGEPGQDRAEGAAGASRSGPQSGRDTVPKRACSGTEKVLKNDPENGL
jgi:hypothetical protein